MNSYDYWKDRENEQLKHNITEEKAYKKKLTTIYKNMMDECQRDIDSFYAKYASKNGITMAEAKKRASKLDIEEFSRKAAKYVEDKDFSKEANDAMKIYNLTMKVNRLELLKANLGLELAKGHGKIYQMFYKALKKRSIDEFKRQSGILGKTVQNNAKFAESIVNASFHNATFSERIWMHQDLLKSDLDKLLQTGLIQGKNPRVLARELTKRFDVKINDAEKLMITEMARVQTATQKRSYIENGFNEYQYISCGGSDVCDVCKALDGKCFKVTDMVPGLNAPPMHPKCHCSTAPHADRKEYDEWLDFLDKGGTTKEWGEIKKSNVSKNVKGLSAQIGNNTVAFHEEPKLLKNIDYSNKKEVLNELNKFEKDAINKKIETACVVTKSGKVYKCFGLKDRVFPDFDLGDELRGSSVSHNHPIEETTFSFSKDDLNLFLEYDLEILRGCDEKYTYELTRDKTLIDSEPDNWMNFENYSHADIIRTAKEYGIGYRRWLNE